MTLFFVILDACFWTCRDTQVSPKISESLLRSNLCSTARIARSRGALRLGALLIPRQQTGMGVWALSNPRVKANPPLKGFLGCLRCL